MKTQTLLLLIQSTLAQQIYDPKEIRSEINELPVTCSSTIRLQNVSSRFFLHSMEAGYGSGSGQQVVTCHRSNTENGGLWTVKEADPETTPEPVQCETGVPMTCGSTIRLEHMETGKNLHSHSEHRGPISRKNEVSGFGDDGEGDNFDNWLIECLDTYGL